MTSMDSGPADRDPRGHQEIDAGRDAYSANRDMTVIHIHGPEAGPAQAPGLMRRVLGWGSVPARNPGFTGRAKLLEEVRTQLLAGDRAVVQALHGMGGVGKTQLAIEYMHRFAAEYDVVWWIAAERSELIAERFELLAAELGCTLPGAELDAVRRAVLAELHGRDRWLVVFDNAEDPEDLAPWLPGGTGHVLITSRAHRWEEMAVRIQIDVLDRSESIAILRRRVPALSEADADGIAEAVGDLPLAISQAAGYMDDTGRGAAEYTGLLGARAAEILDQGRPSSYPQSLAAVTQLAVERLREEDPAASDLARLCAFLSPEPIPAAWFTCAAAELSSSLAGKASDPVAWGQVLARIGRQALVRIDHHGLQMHRLTAAIIGQSLSPPEQAAARAAAERLVVAAAPAITGDLRGWPLWAAILPHLLHLDPATSENGDLRLLACDATLVLYLRGDYNTAQDLSGRLYRAWSDSLGQDHPDTLYAANNLARSRFRLGDHEGARLLDEDTLTRRRRVRGEDHPDTLHSASNLARDLQAIGDHEGALTLLIDNFARRCRVLGEDHTDTLHSANRLAGTLHDLGLYRAARALQEDILSRSRRVFGEDSPETLRSASDLAVTLQALGECRDARALQEDTLARRRQVLGDDHPYTLDSASHLVLVLRELGEHQAAIDLGEDTLARMRRVLGADRPQTVAMADSLAALREQSSPGPAPPEQPNG